MNLTRCCSQPTLIITVELFTISEPTSTNLARNWPSHTLQPVFVDTSFRFAKRWELPIQSDPSISIRIWPFSHNLACFVFSSQPLVCNFNDLVSWNGIEYDSWGELQVKHLLGFVNLTHPGKVWHSKLSMATSSNYSTLGLNINGIQGHCVFTFLVLCFKGPL